MNKLFRLVLSVATVATLSYAGSAQAQIAAVSATGTGTFNNATSLLIDGVIPGEGTNYNASTNVFWSGTTPTFTVDLGALYNVQDLVVSVDNNDTYQLQYSTNNVTYTNLFAIVAGVGNVNFGMDTFSTQLGNGQYEPTIDFGTVQARYIRAFATSGDDAYSIGEIQAFGTAVTAAPEPGSVVLLLGGLGITAVPAVRRKR